MDKIIKAEDLPDGEKVYLKKDLFGWRTVEPIKDDNGKIKWKRIILGTGRERVFMIFIILLVLFSYLGFKEQVDNYYKVLSNPCAYCIDCQAHTEQILKGLNNFKVNREINLTLIPSDTNG